MGQVLAKGANAPLNGPQAVVQVSSGTLVDLAALLVTASGKVRSDDDFIFYNQPNGPGVQLQPPSTLQLNLPAVPAEIEKIVLTASLDGTGPATFGAAGQVSVSVRDGSGAEAASFAPTGLGPETALLLVEIYRRQGAWKVRAVGQGYASGLEGIATDFGITVDQPAAAPPPPPSAPPSAPGPPAGGMVNLDKGRVSLSKGQSVSLVKTGAAPLTRVRMGLGWDTGRGEDIDLDASCILYDRKNKDTDKVWFMSKKGDKGHVVHQGDNLTGAGEGDDEVINVDLANLSKDVQSLVFVVNSFSGQKFTAVSNAFCRLVDDVSNQELVRFDLSDSKPQTGLVMCKIQRGAGDSAGWVMTAIGEFHDGKTVRAMVDPAKRYL
ncbi:MAG TPA: TerD family protein [Frankiaceae bacterium]|nr:TerD family protein [Frankiaceae bacterium]